MQIQLLFVTLVHIEKTKTMEIILLLTTLLTIMLLGVSRLRDGKIYLFGQEQIDDYKCIKYNLINYLSSCAVKFRMKDLYLLNIVTLFNIQKGAQTTPVYTEFHTYWG